MKLLYFAKLLSITEAAGGRPAGHHLVRDIGVADGGLCVLDVLGHHRQVVRGVVETVRDRTESTTDAGNLIDRILDDVHRSLRAFRRADIDVVNTERLGVHIANGYLELVVIIRGIADLEGQSCARLGRTSGETERLSNAFRRAKIPAVSRSLNNTSFAINGVLSVVSQRLSQGRFLSEVNVYFSPAIVSVEPSVTISSVRSK